VLAAWICFIWGNSLLGGPESDANSIWFVQLLEPAFRAFGITSVPAMDHIVRKTAHFVEYLVLGLLATAAFRPRWRAPAQGLAAGERRRSVVPAIAIACVVPIVDECIQLGVPGRSGRPTDVLLDMCGAATGLLIGAIVLSRRRTREE
jgi:VanZ family protein